MKEFSIWMTYMIAIVKGVMFKNSGYEYCLSDTPEIWNVATNSSELLSISYIREHGWDNMTSLLPKGGAPIWIAARATYTPYFSFEGYYLKNGTHATCPNRVFSWTSIADCQRNCKYSGYFALKGNECVCMEAKTCLEPWWGLCNEMSRCLYNPMDKCGDCKPRKDVYVVYEAIVGKKVDEASNSEELCVYVIRERSGQHHYSLANCETRFIRRYICIDSGNVIFEDALDAVTWYEAQMLCIEKRMKPHYITGSSKGSELVPYWTSIKRGIDINWMDGPRSQNIDERHSLCVSAMLSSSRGLMLKEENCRKQYHFLYNCGKEEEEINEQKENNGLINVKGNITWSQSEDDDDKFVLPFDYKWLFLAPLLVIPFIIWFLKRKRVPESRDPCFNSPTTHSPSDYITPCQANASNRTDDPKEPPPAENVYDELPDLEFVENEGYRTLHYMPLHKVPPGHST